MLHKTNQLSHAGTTKQHKSTNALTVRTLEAHILLHAAVYRSVILDDSMSDLNSVHSMSAQYAERPPNFGPNNQLCLKVLL